MIRFKNISKSYGEKTILSDLSSELPDRGLVAFVGANGAGKSTLLNIIARILDRDSGDIEIDDKNLEAYPSDELARKISFLSQSNNINIRLTVRELVQFGRFPYSKGRLTDEDRQKVERAMGFLRISDIADKRLDELSGGQRQLAYIAMIIAQDTKYIFLDEPLNNLDLKHSAELMDILARLIDEEDKVIFLVVHDLNFVAAHADYVIAMKDGDIIYKGDKNELLSGKILNDVFDFDFDIVDIENQKFCLYYKCRCRLEDRKTVLGLES